MAMAQASGSGQASGASASGGHVPVLLAEVLVFLKPRPGAIFVDATLGGGGYTEALLESSGPDGSVVALDRDRDALRAAEARLAAFASRLTPVWGSFADLDRHLDELGLGEVDGVVADLGLSSLQLGEGERGFAFSKEGPLDMRFDRSQGPTAAELVNTLDEESLADILYEFGEERRSRAIARRLVARRPIRTTGDLRSGDGSIPLPVRSRRSASP
jgi:16S rRNA (cytosine1402-N4)-methyltransferase